LPSDPREPTREDQGTGSLTLMVARMLVQVTKEPLVIVGAEAARTQQDHHVSLPCGC
jgi:hypothetical protein